MADDDVFPIHIDQRQSATIHCEQGDLDEVALNAAEVAGVLRDGAMHAVSSGHTVHEHVSRDLIVVAETI